MRAFLKAGGTQATGQGGVDGDRRKPGAPATLLARLRAALEADAALRASAFTGRFALVMGLIAHHG